MVCRIINYQCLANWITDFDEHLVQYLPYLPYGELICNQTIAGYDERYKFTGKERDEESGYDYFGARFYSSPLSFWLSVDPLAGKYPNISSYAYCGWNPVKYIDPDGKEKHNKMNPLSNDIYQQSLFEAGNNFIDKDRHIFFISHGASNMLYPNGASEMGAEDFVRYLLDNSDLWNTTENKSLLTIVLIACETGKGEHPIAEQISKLLPETTIIAPTEEVKAAGNGSMAQIFCVAKSEATTLSAAKTEEFSGQWKAFRNGKVIGTSDNGKINYIYKDEF